MTGYSESIINSKVHLNMLNKYEAINLFALVDNDASKLVFQNALIAGNQYNDQPNDASKNLLASLKNPYFSIYHWCRGEIADLEALRIACSQLNRFNESIARR